MGDATPSQQPKKRGRKVSQTGDNKQKEAPQAEKKKQRRNSKVLVRSFSFVRLFCFLNLTEIRFQSNKKT